MANSCTNSHSPLLLAREPQFIVIHALHILVCSRKPGHTQSLMSLTHWELLERHVLRLHPKLPESETLGLEAEPFAF